MHNTLNDCLGAVKKNKRFRINSITVLLILSLLVSANVFWGLRQTGLTLAGTAACGYEEHTHSDECYNRILVCSISNDLHTHGDACYKSELVCQKQEHVHKLTCYSDRNADTETQLDWQKMLESLITGDSRSDLVAIARSQIGYKESTLNFETDADLVRHGYTRYGAWYGAPYTDWSAAFVSFCLNYAGYSSDEAPRNIGVTAMRKAWDSAGRYAKKSNYSPAYGDIVFFDDDTVGIITAVNFDMLTVVKGDVMGEVCERIVSEYSDTIVGYGVHDTVKGGGLSSGGIVATDFVLSKCDCGNESLPAESHSDTCAYKKQLKDVATDYTVLDIYEIWDVLPEDAREYILDYLTRTDTDKRAAVEDICANGLKKIDAKCDNASFAVEGALPQSVTLDVSLGNYTEQQKKAYINPNIVDNVNWSAIYDITLYDGDAEYEPTSCVKVKFALPDLQFDCETEFFAVAHIDSATGEITDSVYVEFKNGYATFVTDGFSPYLFYTVDKEVEGGEKVLGTNWIDLKNSDFFTYWQQYLDADQPIGSNDTTQSGDKPSSSQINSHGGETKSDKGDDVEISKTIAGTDIENVFDITLTVKTSQNISEIVKEPDMAVVIVMDISNTMNDNFGGVTRYAAAMEAAEDFIDNFVSQTSGISKIGYVAFNTDAHQIFGLQSCSTETEANALKNTMRTATGKIISADGYKDSHSRFTNVEAGLKMGYDMLKDAGNKNKYIIFLSDGFPTTYISSGYSGYDPYTPSGNKGADGVFYDYVLKKYCSYGTSYSDKAAIRAREMATTIKNDDVKIFSIGVDVGGQTIQKYITNSEKSSGFSVVDRTETTYEIGDATSTEAYKNWLKNSIGSGYYYDSTNTDGLKAAYNDIFEKIKSTTEEASKADWVANDPIPLAPPEYIEFIGFYDKSSNLLSTDSSLVGSVEVNGENQATFTVGKGTEDDLSHIDWDLKQSGYTTSQDGGTTYYYYKLVYRVRLKNELERFVEKDSYDTNATTTLTYRVYQEVDGTTTLSERRTLEFKIPSVHGYLADLEFKKVDSLGNMLAGAEFMLKHDDANCTVCRGDGKSHVIFGPFTATSDENGKVVFKDIPSGHKYVLTETSAPPGYVIDNKSYHITIAYDKLTYGDDWNAERTIVNKAGLELPATGGGGELPFILIGLALIVLPVIYRFACIRRRKREGRER